MRYAVTESLFKMAYDAIMQTRPMICRGSQSLALRVAFEASHLEMPVEYRKMRVLTVC